MQLRHLSDEELLVQTQRAVAREKEATLSVLHHLREVERRQLHLISQSSLHDYCVEELGYDKTSAHLRISAMRLLRELPELEEKVESGGLNLSLLAQAQSFFRKEEISSLAEKREILNVIDGKSTRDAQRELLDRAEVPERHLPERIWPVSRTHSELRLVVDEKMLEQLKELQALLAHSHPGASLKEVIEYAVQKAIEKKTPKKPQSNQVTVPAQNQRNLAEIKRIVWHRDGGRCGYVGPDGRKCGSRRTLEYDHIRPQALGGETSADNLRLRCRAHNRLAAIGVFGAEKLAEFVPSMR